jgi:hypothetical protein
VFGTATALRAGDCSCPRKSRSPLDPSQPPTIQWVSASPPPPPPGEWFDHSLLSRAEVKNEWSYTATPLHTFMMSTVTISSFITAEDRSVPVFRHVLHSCSLGTDQWRAVVNANKCCRSIKCEKFLTSWGTVSFMGRTGSVALCTVHVYTCGLNWEWRTVGGKSY